MTFVNRRGELDALRDMKAGLAVVWGRRRIGKTRLLLEWCEEQGGVYAVADQSSPEVQRTYLSRALAQVLPGFADVTYPDWERLLTRLAADAIGARFTGPLVLDELPYLIDGSPELPSILQRWIDHDAKRAHLRIAVAGSSQRMMQGLVLADNAPLYGRARVLMGLAPMGPRHLAKYMGLGAGEVLDHWTAWGGIPRYWELASDRTGTARDRVVAIALDPLGPLFSEPERLLLEESPPAAEVRPLLDAIGGGAHRLSEIAGRLARQATSLARPLDRLLGMGLIRREVPYGEPARGGKRSLYKIDDPFLRLWFRVVAPNRGALSAGTSTSRAAILARHWEQLRAQAWEDLCRSAIPVLSPGDLASLGPWQPARRYWHGEAPEWDLVADAVAGKRVLVGEAWCSEKTPTIAAIRSAARNVAARPLPPIRKHGEVVRALFVSSKAAGVPRVVESVHVVTLRDLL